jgi:hypothetical protein
MLFHICSRHETNKEPLLHNDRDTRDNVIKQRLIARKRKRKKIYFYSHCKAADKLHGNNKLQQ